MNEHMRSAMYLANRNETTNRRVVMNAHMRLAMDLMNRDDACGTSILVSIRNEL